MPFVAQQPEFGQPATLSFWSRATRPTRTSTRSPSTWMPLAFPSGSACTQTRPPSSESRWIDRRARPHRTAV